MNYLHRIIIFIALIISSANAFASSGPISIIAKVDNRVITNIDLLNRYKIILKMSKVKANNAGEKQIILSQILQKMIDEELQIKEATNLNIELDQEKFDQVKAEIAGDLHQSPSNLENYFSAQSIAYDSFMRQIEAQILWSDVVRHNIAPKIKVSQSEIDELLELRKVKSNIEKYFIAEIFIPSQDDDQIVDSKSLASKLFDELKAGKSFEKIVSQFSRSPTAEFNGEIGWIGKGDVDERIYKAVSVIKVGDVTQPVVMDDGYHLFKLVRKKSFNTLSDQDNEQLTNIIFNKKLQLLSKGYLMDLKKDAYIEIDREALEDLSSK